ncbi:TlpA disulfide reductase family protein [Salinimicrobium xinjiangense]|uniref:TlpA disulfide reductase family protein n=1 Tax=Salinimicrobium xinjiangense TaxID=438596 RepID=UPI0004147D87|nr:TlpA disulfide reductase family protein [Salinimicrobium xinjiangense]
MRKFLIIGLIALFASCEADKDQGYSISGTVKNGRDGQKVFISELNESNTQTVPVDTATITNGTFELDLPEKEAPAIAFLSIEGARGNVVYIADNTPMAFEIYPDSMFASNVTGGRDNEVLYGYLNELRKTNKKLITARDAMRDAYNAQDTATLDSLDTAQQGIVDIDKENKRELVQNNPNSIVALMILQDMINTQAFSASELNSLFDNLAPELKNSALGKNIKTSLDRMSKSAIGSMAPNFTAPTPSGEQLTLKDVLGKVTLVDFWAAWCRPCRVENPNIVEVYKKYHDKGFNIVQVSLDRPGQKDKWIQAIEDDNLDEWHHVSHLMFWQDPVAAEYGVRAIPAAFLLDEQGKIIAKDLRGPALGEKVGEILDK